MLRRVIKTNMKRKKRKEKKAKRCLKSVLYTRSPWEVKKSLEKMVSRWVKRRLFLRWGLDVVGEPGLGSSQYQMQTQSMPSSQGVLTRPSKIPVPSVATLGATYHSLSFNLVSCSALIISSGSRPIYIGQSKPCFRENCSTYGLGYPACWQRPAEAHPSFRDRW